MTAESLPDSADRARPLTVVYVSDSTTVSGAEHVLFHYLERFRPPRFYPHVVFRSSNARMQRALDGLGVPYTATDAFTTRVIRTTWRPDDLWSFARAFLRIRKELIGLIRRERADVIHSISYPSSLYVSLAARATGVPQVWHEHNIKAIHRFNAPIYRWVAGSCGHVIGPSDAVIRALAVAGIGRPPLRTVYNGIDLARFAEAQRERARMRQELGLVDGQPAVGLVGQLLPYKGHRTLIEAAPAILAQHPSTRFYVVGALENPPYEADLRAAIRASGLEQQFAFTGWRPDVHAVVAAMDVSVVATLTPEPAALSLMESMAIGCPLIASRTGGTPEIVVDRQTGLLFTPGDAVSLASLVNELFADPALGRRLTEAGRRRMNDRFSLERHLDEVDTLYRSCAWRPARKRVESKPGQAVAARDAITG